MTEEDIVSELYGAMQTFRGLGFPSDNLYVAFGIVPEIGPFADKKCVGVILRWNGKEFAYSIAPVRNQKKFAKRWVRFATAANEAPADDPELRRVYLESICRQNAAQLVMALTSKGINPPLGAN